MHIPDCRMVCLTGFMGSGKSTVGRLLASQLAWHFFDLDSEIEGLTELSIAQIFEQRGEAVFRDIEYDCLTRILGRAAERDSRLVLALGGGTYTQARNAESICAYGLRFKLATIWLDCGMEQLLQRCVLMGDRPLFRDEASFRKLYEERLPYYQQADYRIESNEEPARVVERILGLGIFAGASGVMESSHSTDRNDTTR